jgi:hypothetical protein
MVAAPGELREVALAAAGSEPLLWVGDGLRTYPEIASGQRVAHEALDVIRGVAVAVLGQVEARAGGPGLDLQPVYLRRSEAELNLGPPTGASVLVER